MVEFERENIVDAAAASDGESLETPAAAASDGEHLVVAYDGEENAIDDEMMYDGEENAIENVTMIEHEAIEIELGDLLSSAPVHHLRSASTAPRLELQR